MRRLLIKKCFVLQFPFENCQGETRIDKVMFLSLKLQNRLSYSLKSTATGCVSPVPPVLRSWVWWRRSDTFNCFTTCLRVMEYREQSDIIIILQSRDSHEDRVDAALPPHISRCVSHLYSGIFCSVTCYNQTLCSAEASKRSCCSSC